MSPAVTHTVAVFNASDDTLAMLEALLSQRGYRAVVGEADQVKSGQVDFIDFLNKHRPDALIWDIAPPYDRNWNFFQLVRDLRTLAGCALVLTTTHKQHLDTLAGQDTRALEVIGKPYDLELIVDAVSQGIKRLEDARRRPFGQIAGGPTPA
jgi:DNA-binding response OmpR family regulator